MKTILFLTLGYIAFGSTEEIKQRILGENFATPGEFPYQVSIQFDGKHHCGGGIISKKHILTAAHCLYDIIVTGTSYSRLKIIAGTTTLPGGITYDVHSMAVHPSYVHSDTAPIMMADVALMQTHQVIVESAYVKIIALPFNQRRMTEGQQLEISGFGSSELHGAVSPYLKKVTMYSTSWETCEKYFPKLSPVPGMFCAILAPGHGVCQGDSGGPVTANKKFIYGIVSATDGGGCGTGKPDVFTYVPFSLDFIYEFVHNGISNTG